MTDLFISYSRQDLEQVESLARALEEAGLSVWWDRRIRSGDSFDRVIESAIAEAKVVIVAWSRHSSDSTWVRAEAGFAMEKKKLVPVRLDDTPPPLRFLHVHTIDLAGRDGGLDQAALARLIADLKEMLGGTPAASSAAAAPAPPPPRPRRSKALPLALGIVAILAAAALGYFASRETRQPVETVAARAPPAPAAPITPAPAPQAVAAAPPKTAKPVETAKPPEPARPAETAAAPEAAPPPPPKEPAAAPPTVAPPAPAEPVLEALEKEMTAAHAAPLRAAPDLKAKQVGRLKEGESIHVAGKVKDAEWYAVEPKGQPLAYVAAAVLEETAAFTARKEAEREKAKEREREAARQQQAQAAATSATAAPPPQLAALPPAPVPAAPATKAATIEGRYAGRLVCAQIPNSTARPVDVDAVVVVSGTAAEFSRDVLSMDAKQVIGKEVAKGAIAADGSVSLSGGADGPGWHFESHFEGALKDGKLVLTGRERIPRPGGQIFDRDCSVSLVRQ